MEQTQTGAVALRRMQEETVNNVLERINLMKGAGDLNLPEHYSPGNALKLAWLELQTVLDRNKKPALEVCTKESVCNALLEMTIKGLSVAKKQGYFIVYGNKLEFQPDYRGNIMIARRDAGVAEVNSQVIYEGDEYIIRVDQKGVKQLVKHETKLDNIDNNKIKGAYAVVVFTDGRTKLEEMTLAQIKKSWMQGAANGNSGAHNNFTDQMCKKTVISRALKIEIGSSDDKEVMMHGDEEKPRAATMRNETISQGANTEELPVDDVSYEEVQPESQPESQPQGPSF